MSCRCRAMRATCPGKTAIGWNSSFTAARCCATAVTIRLPPATTVAGTLRRRMSPNIIGSRMNIEQLRRSLADPHPHPDPATLQALGGQTMDWVVRHFTTLPDQGIGLTGSRDQLEAMLRE